MNDYLLKYNRITRIWLGWVTSFFPNLDASWVQSDIKLCNSGLTTSTKRNDVILVWPNLKSSKSIVCKSCKQQNRITYRIELSTKLNFLIWSNQLWFNWNNLSNSLVTYEAFNIIKILRHFSNASTKQRLSNLDFENN